MKAPACDPSDFCIALRAESTLLIPEIAKSTRTPKRFQHVSPFAWGFIFAKQGGDEHGPPTPEPSGELSCECLCVAKLAESSMKMVRFRL
jgi:hypothetical protein